MWRTWAAPLCIAGGGGGWRSRCGKWRGGSPKFKRTIVKRSSDSTSRQTPHRKQGLKGIFAHTRARNSAIHKERRGEVTQAAIERQTGKENVRRVYTDVS